MIVVSNAEAQKVAARRAARAEKCVPMILSGPGVQRAPLNPLSDSQQYIEHRGSSAKQYRHTPSRVLRLFLTDTAEDHPAINAGTRIVLVWNLSFQQHATPIIVGRHFNSPGTLCCDSIQKRLDGPQLNLF